MHDVFGCNECREIALELEQACAPIAKSDAAIDQQTLERWHAAWRCYFTQEDKTRPLVAPEILHLNQYFDRARRVHPFARAYRKKIKHERRTGHTIAFPPAKWRGDPGATV